MDKGKLYIVATPIGNLKDFTYRATEILSNVDIIACEDTRVTSKLLNSYGINTKTISYHKFSEKQRSEILLKYLLEGKNVALVSDAGTPLISDPGSILIEEVKKSGINVIPIPGACAAVTALSAIVNDGIFAFLGFFPQKISEIEKLKNYINDFDLIFYESPNRIIKTLEILRELFGEIRVSIARELTKIYEDINTFSISQMINYLQRTTLKGEITLIIHKNNEKKEDFEFLSSATKLLNDGFSAKDTAKILSLLFGLPKNEIYKKIVENNKKNIV